MQLDLTLSAHFRLVSKHCVLISVTNSLVVVDADSALLQQEVAPLRADVRCHIVGDPIRHVMLHGELSHLVLVLWATANMVLVHHHR